MIRNLFFIILLFLGNKISAQNWININGGYRSPLLSLTSSVDKLYIGVYSTEPGDYHIKIWDGAILDSLDCGNHPFKMIYQNGFLYECGCTIGLRKFDGNNWQSVGVPGVNGIIKDFHFYNNEIYAIGSFDSINGVPIFNGIARWDGNNWYSIDTTTFTGGGLRFCFHYNGELYVGGAITNWDHTLATCVKWNGTSWENIGLDTLSGSFNPMAATVYKNEIYLGGYMYSSLLGDGLIRFDGTAWNSVGGGITHGIFQRVTSFHEINNELFVGGVFDSVGNIPASMIAVWDGNSWCSLCTNIDGPIFALTNYGDSLVVGGQFNTVDADTMKNLAMWRGGNNYNTCYSLTGIREQLEGTSISLFPNPADDKLQIQISKTWIDKIKIFNILGEEIYSKEISGASFQLDISFLNNGLYFLIIETKEGRVVKKFVKE